MILKMAEKMNREDDGFTLIELLVVIIIIGILAAIAIPVFLNQRQRGWRATIQSDLRNAAIVMETELTDEGTYAGLLGSTAFDTSEGVTITATQATSTAYCLDATGTLVTDLGETWSYANNRTPNLDDVACTTPAP